METKQSEYQVTCITDDYSPAIKISYYNTLGDAQMAASQLSLYYGSVAVRRLAGIDKITLQPVYEILKKAGGNMKTYELFLNRGKGEVSIKTVSRNKPQAIKTVCKTERCPLSAVVRIFEVKP